MSCPKLLFKNEATCEAIGRKMIFDSDVNKTYFHKKGFEAFQLILLSGGHVDHLRVHQDHVLIFFIIFNLTLICHLSGQEAIFVRSLT